MTEPYDYSRVGWPNTLVEVAEVLEAHFRRSRSFHADPELAATALAIELASVFGGRTVYLPQPTRLRIVRRNQAIQRDRAEGVAIDDLTAIYGLSARKVRHIVGESS